MEKQQLEHYKKLLINEREEVLNTMERMDDNEPNDSMQEYFDELSVNDNHPADLGTEMFMMEQNMNLKNVERLRLREIEISLDKIKNGSYGICDLCGKEIGEGRLEVVPEAKICMDCALDKIPIDEMMEYRPIEEDNLEYPFGRTFNDISQEDVVGFDGEDSWQAVIRYNDIPNDPSFNTMDHLGYFDERESGIVEDIEQISEGFYKGQIEGQDREDIPEEQMKKKPKHGL